MSIILTSEGFLDRVDPTKAGVVDLSGLAGGQSANMLHTGMGAMANRNRIMNGDFRRSSYNGNAAVTPALNSYIVDRWRFDNAAPSKITFQRVADGPIGGSGYSLKATVASQYAPGAAEGFVLHQPIEGQVISDLAWGASSGIYITTQFQVKSSVIGAFNVQILNGAANRSYVGSYAIAQANVWTPLVLFIPGDTAGTWATDSTCGMYLLFDLGSGANFGAVAGWQAGNVRVLPGTKQFVNQAAGATWQLAEVQLEPGSIKTPRAPYCGIFGGEEQACLRYLPRFASVGTVHQFASGYSVGTTSGYGFAPYAVKPRVAPTGLLLSSVSHVTVYNGGWNACTGLVLNGLSTDAAWFVASTAGGLSATNGAGCNLMFNDAAGQILCTGCEL